MSIDLKGQQCPVCKAYLFEEDDVVFCPICGAPHHRECYEKIGHCALEEFHGTEFEYSKVKSQQKSEVPKSEEPKTNGEQLAMCPFCYNEFPVERGNCPHCGRPNTVGSFGGVNFDPLGNVPADFKLDEEVTVREAARFVMSSSNRYMPKFAKFSAGGKISWNWAAFLVPEAWALHRKMTKVGIISIALVVLAAIFMMPFTTEYNNILSSVVGQGQITMETYTEIAKQLSSISFGIRLLSYVAVGLELATRFFFALFGDYIYFKYTIATIKEIKKDKTVDQNERFAKQGGSNLLLLLVGILITSYLPTILMYIVNLF